MYNKILVPYDFSMPADKALEYAVKLAKTVNHDNLVEVILLHVIAELPLHPLMEIKESASAPLTASIIEHIEKVHDEASKYVAHIIEKNMQRYVSSGITLRSAVLKGTPVEKILEYAEKEKVDLIILGNLGWGEIARSRTIGSVARGVVESAYCPVTVVHQ